MLKKIILLIFLSGCFASEREAIKKAFTPEKKEEKKEEKPKQETLLTPDIWKDCDTLKKIAKNLAPGCWEEVANHCVKGTARKDGECPTCDGLDKVNAKLAEADCFLDKTDKESM